MKTDTQTFIFPKEPGEIIPGLEFTYMGVSENLTAMYTLSTKIMQSDGMEGRFYLTENGWVPEHDPCSKITHEVPLNSRVWTNVENKAQTYRIASLEHEVRDRETRIAELQAELNEAKSASTLASSEHVKDIQRFARIIELALLRKED